MLLTVTAHCDNLLVTAKPPSFLDVGVSQAYLPWKQRLDVLLNTPQATANQFEALVWDGVNHCLIDDLDGVPYVELMNTINPDAPTFLASTLTLPHRIGTAYLAKHKDAKLDGERFRDVLKAAVRQDGIYRAVFRLDPFSIVFGCFLSHIQGTMRIPRVLSGQFVAENAVSMPNGGASHDPVSAAGDSIVTKGYFFNIKKEKGKEKLQSIPKASAVGLGNIPYVRESYQAERYLGKFVLDTRLVRASALPEVAKETIDLLAQYVLVKLLSAPIMLRSECYLEPVETRVRGDLDGLPDLATVTRSLKAAIAACRHEGLWNGVTTVGIPVKLEEVEEGSGNDEGEED